MAAASSACGSSSPASPSSASATLNVMLKDAPFSDAKALLVTFTGVSVHATGGDFSSVPFVEGTSRTCDLKKLATAQDVLGIGALAPGHYTQVRLIVSTAAIYFDNPSSGAPCATSIDTPSGRNAAVIVPSGDVRINREFDITTTKATTMLLDFNGDQSVRQQGDGQYVMSPVIAVVSVQ